MIDEILEMNKDATVHDTIATIDQLTKFSLTIVFSDINEAIRFNLK